MAWEGEMIPPGGVALAQPASRVAMHAREGFGLNAYLPFSASG